MCARAAIARLRKLLVVLVAFATLPLWAVDNPVIAVLDFQVDQVSQNEMKTLVSLLSSALFATGAFTVIDVAQRDTLLKEIEFSVKDCTDEACQVEIGRLLAAEYVVVGRLGKIGKKYVVSSKLLETSSSKTVRTADGVYDELEGMVGNLPILARRLAGTAGRGAAGRSTRRVVLGVGSGLGAVGCGVGAGVLLVMAGRDYRGSVSPAYTEYLQEPEGSADFASLYQAYLDAFGSYQGKMLPGLALAGGAVVLGGVSVLLLALPAKRDTGGAAVSVAVSPTSLFVRLSW